MVEDKTTYWDGVRSYAARIFLYEMKAGDLCLFYHSNEGKEIVGICKVIKESYQDPTTDDDRWVAVDVEAIKPLEENISLAQLKADNLLKDMRFVRQSRLSVAPVTKKEFDKIMKISGTSL